MNRRDLLTSITALAGSTLALEALAQSGQQITHVDTKTKGALLLSSIVKTESLRPEGDAPGAKAYVNFNGPTEQLAALASGFVTLVPGAQPHPPHRHIEEEIMIVGEGTGEFSVNGIAAQVRGHGLCRIQCAARRSKHRADANDVLLHQDYGKEFLLTATGQRSSQL